MKDVWRYVCNVGLVYIISEQYIAGQTMNLVREIDRKASFMFVIFYCKHQA